MRLRIDGLEVRAAIVESVVVDVVNVDVGGGLADLSMHEEGPGPAARVDLADRVNAGVRFTRGPVELRKGEKVGRVN